MKHKIISIKLGFVNVFLVPSESGAILVDTGAPGSMNKLEKELAIHGLEFSDIKLIVITHGHADHTGLAAELAKRTGAPVAMHKSDAEWLQQGKGMGAIPVTTGAKIMVALIGAMESRQQVTPCSPEILLEDQPFPLHEYGIAGKIIHTPGHTPGSLSVILDDGQAIVGDIAMNNVPVMRWGAGLPSIASDLEQIKKSWQMMLENGVTRVYPGHGKDFDAAVIRSQL